MRYAFGWTNRERLRRWGRLLWSFDNDAPTKIRYFDAEIVRLAFFDGRVER